ncbi:Histone acetyltransferase [Azospirillaceae bacterium]
MDFEFDATTRPKFDDLAVVQAGLRAHNEKFTGKSPALIAVFLREPETKKIRGGIAGFLVGPSAMLDWLWVDESLRGQGYGAQLMREIEKLIVSLKCDMITLNTFTFQAPGFYPKLGYQLLAQIPNFMLGNTKYYYRKHLVYSEL